MNKVKDESWGSIAKKLASCILFFVFLAVNFLVVVDEDDLECDQCCLKQKGVGKLPSNISLEANPHQEETQSLHCRWRLQLCGTYIIYNIKREKEK